MNTFQFAIASVVDANTGQGLPKVAGQIDYGVLTRHGREIRAKSLLEMLRTIGSRISSISARFTEYRRQRRAIRDLAALNDHLLEDMGFHRGDIIALQMGLVDLDELRERNESRRHSPESTEIQVSRVMTGEFEQAVNEAVFARAKCA